MKRTLPLLLALIVAVAIPSAAFALNGDESVFVHVDTVDVESAGEVDIPVLLDNCEGVDSIQLDLNYDGAAFSVVSVTFGGLFTASEYNDSEPGRVRIACASALGLTEAGTLLTLRLSALGKEGSAVTISNAIVTRVDADYQQSAAFVSIENGGVTVGGAALPNAKVTPWIPPTPTSTPSPEPTPTLSPTPAPTPTTAVTAVLAMAGRIPATAYIVIGALVLILILILFVSAAQRKKDAAQDKVDGK